MKLLKRQKVKHFVQLLAKFNGKTLDGKSLKATVYSYDFDGLSSENVPEEPKEPQPSNTQ
jgi:hypothetical protein